MTAETPVKKAISFHFHPRDFTTGGHAVEKSDGGKKRRYLAGISSGVKLDGHEERMTEKCVKSFMDQANSGQVLLYPDVHGIKSTEDIGTLQNATVEKNGDWKTEYRLYDEADGIGPQKAEKIDTIWKQMTGQAPYKKPLQKGFSIEGFISPDGILEAQKDAIGNVSRRVIDHVDLDGVVLVPRPAYKDSIAQACYKALGELAPHVQDKIRKGVRDGLRATIEGQALQDSYFHKRWEIQTALDEEVDKIMKGHVINKGEALSIAFNEYRDLMGEVLLSSEGLFTRQAGIVQKSQESQPYGTAKISKSEIFRALQDQLNTLANLMKSGG